jgi:hypothetical protein
VQGVLLKAWKKNKLAPDEEDPLISFQTDSIRSAFALVSAIWNSQCSGSSSEFLTQSWALGSQEYLL